jgi:hypothetical protein
MNIINPKTVRKVKANGTVGKRLVLEYGNKISVEELIENKDYLQWLYILLNHTKIESDIWYYENLNKHFQQQGYVSKEDHIKILQYKMKRGEFRPLLMGFAKKLDEDEVKQASEKAIKEEDGLKAIEIYKKLKGTGYALASAVLSAQRNGDVPFMSDDLLSVILDKSPKYNLDELKKCIEYTTKLAQDFNQHQKVWTWTPAQVERVIYVVTQDK